MRGWPEAVPGDAGAGAAAVVSARVVEANVTVPYLASRAFSSASMAGERGAEATGPVPVAGGSSSFPNARPSAGASLTPATTKPNSSIVFAPGPASEARAASLALRSAPILLRRARTDADASPCAGAASAPNCGEEGTDAAGPGSTSPAAGFSDGQVLAPTATAFVSLIDLTPGATSKAVSFVFRSAPILLKRARTEGGACPCPGETRAPNCAGSTSSIEPRAAGPVPPGGSLSLTSFSIWRQWATFF